MTLTAPISTTSFAQRTSTVDKTERRKGSQWPNLDSFPDKNILEAVLCDLNQVLLVEERKPHIPEQNGTLTQGEKESPSLGQQPLLTTFRTHKYKSFIEMKQKWEGYVERITDKFIEAKLYDLTNRNNVDHAKIDMELIADADWDLLKVGAAFYWTMGYQNTGKSTKQFISEIRFRRLPKYTAHEIKEAQAEALEIAEYFKNL